MTNIKSSRQLVAIAMTTLEFVACQSNDTTRSPADEPTTTANEADPYDTLNQMPADTVAMNSGRESTMDKPAAKQANSKSTVTKKKGRATVGTMAQSKTSNMQADKSGVYEWVEVRPSYVGGQTALEEYITEHVIYPDLAVENNAQGRVDVQFMVDEKGNIMDAHVLGEKIGNGLDEEAVRVIANMPKWTAGKVKGKNVKTRVTIPITFKIEE
jgi:periplasmic protein TonB